MGFVDTHNKSFRAPSGTAIPRYSRVTYDAGNNFLAIAGDAAALGFVQETIPSDLPDSGSPAGAADRWVSVRTNTATGTFKAISDGSINKGDQVSSTTSGQVQSGTLGAVDLGTALNDATTAGHIVEIAPL